MFLLGAGARDPGEQLRQTRRPGARSSRATSQQGAAMMQDAAAVAAMPGGLASAGLRAGRLPSCHSTSQPRGARRSAFSTTWSRGSAPARSPPRHGGSAWSTRRCWSTRGAPRRWRTRDRDGSRRCGAAGGQDDERRWLEPLRARAESGRSPAHDALEAFQRGGDRALVGRLRCARGDLGSTASMVTEPDRERPGIPARRSGIPAAQGAFRPV